jgi:predicted nucleotidyltransferase
MKIKSNKYLEPDVSDVITKIKYFGGHRIKFIILYGSAAKGTSTDLSDIDIAVFYSGDKRERFQFRMKILGRIDNYTEIFNTFMKTIREFADYKPRLELYCSNMGV